MDTAPSQTTGETHSADQLPPEAVALASRMFNAARNGDEESVALLTQALGRGLPANLTNDKGDSLVSSQEVTGDGSLHFPVNKECYQAPLHIQRTGLQRRSCA